MNKNDLWRQYGSIWYPYQPISVHEYASRTLLDWPEVITWPPRDRLFPEKVNNFPRYANSGRRRCQNPFSNISYQFWENRLTNLSVKRKPTSGGLDSNSKHLSQLVGEGVPFNLRSIVYPLICRVTQKQLEEYQKLPEIIHGDKTIEKDLLRTLPGNIFFMRISDEGAQVIIFYIT